MTTRWARVARGGVAALLSVFVAAFSHVISGGTQPNSFAMVACLVLATLVCVALAGKRMSLPRLAVSVGFSQLLFHGIFSLWSAPAIPIDAGHHPTDGQMLMSVTTMPAPAGQVATDSSMWLAHAIAAVITIAVLRYGEKAFWGLLEIAQFWIGALISRPTRGPLPSGMHPVPVAAVPTFLPRDLVLFLSSMRHRGPPLRIGQIALP
ncbi:MAG: hypothetical protein JWM70_816 [Microbacteriaceae bacterium]|nr:hypothetical protein [Microbacteriaceae bacterium]